MKQGEGAAPDQATTLGLTPFWRIWVDVGGTFTDGLALGPDRRLRRVKVLSSGALRGVVTACAGPDRLIVRESWAVPAELVRGLRFRLTGTDGAGIAVRNYAPESRLLTLAAPLGATIADGATFEVVSDEGAPVFVARLLTGTPAPVPLPPSRMRLATTLGTNALLQRSGVPPVLFITRGLGDLLAIGTQQRSELFSLAIEKPAPLYGAVVEVPERLDSNGAVVHPLEADEVEKQARDLLSSGARVAAVALMHSYRNPEHESRLKQRLLTWGFEHVSCSSELAPRIKLLPRAETAVVDAYLSPVLQGQLDHVAERLPGGSLLVMTSAGGLLDPRAFRPKDALLSGPAGGVAGSAVAGRNAGLSRWISFDMGGTSTDVARYDGDYEYRYTYRVGDVQLVTPALAIETVAAGGGSVCWLDDQRLRVGPESAGASPGPACYDAGGPLTLTDVNLLLGRLDPARFRIPIRLEPARKRFQELEEMAAERTGRREQAEQLLEGLLDIANETMAGAMRRVSVRRGYDPAEHALVAFGGAGAQHACAVAERLGTHRVLVPPDASLLSAVGLGHAVVERFEELQVLLPLEGLEQELPQRFAALEARAVEAVASAGVDREGIEIRRRLLHLRFAGQDATVEVEWVPDRPAREAFAERYERLFGHRPERRQVELESLSVVASEVRAPADVPEPEPEASEAVPEALRPVWFSGRWIEAPVFDRARLVPGARLDGPALILEDLSSTVVEPGWQARVHGSGALLLEKVEKGDRFIFRSRKMDLSPESVRLELFTQQFTTLVREMGERLERTAVSTNVKERLDFSCALLDAGGNLVANAPHIPVHLGALGLCVRRVAEALPLAPGDVAVTNHPAFGGSHLPDVTVITPVFDGPGDAARLVGYTASRAHHAEIGGRRPGSMPPDARCLAEEGVLLSPDYLIRAGNPRWDDIRRRLEQGPFPSRSVEDNLADLRAAVAANHAGARALGDLVAAHGAPTVDRYMRRLRELAAASLRAALRRLGDGSYAAREQLDDGTPLAVRIVIEEGRAHIDFAGTGGVHPGNLNATPAVVRSVVIYVMRLLVAEPLPLNEGLLDPVTLEIPAGLLNPPFPEDPREAPAVVGGNVETSQRLVDTLLRALRLAACSQGTMNNLIFGNPSYGYYETLGGGSGAAPGFHGASAVHSHMTNTRITDVEILEQRYPVRVERFAIRAGSGGGGRFRGGNGLIRELRFLEPASVSVLTQHRVVEPYGLAGGEPGARGRQRVLRESAAPRELGAIDGCDVLAGDVLVVETPGGGGYGARRSVFVAQPDIQ